MFNDVLCADCDGHDLDWGQLQIQPDVCSYKVLLEHAHARSFAYHPWLLPSHDGRAEWL